MTDLQTRVAAWHARRFPTAGAAELGLKASSEVGELCEALQAVIDDREPRDGHDAAYEAADVLVVILALVGRYFPGRDLLAETEARVTRFENPNGGHRSCVKG